MDFSKNIRQIDAGPTQNREVNHIEKNLTNKLDNAVI